MQTKNNTLNFSFTHFYVLTFILAWSKGAKELEEEDRLWASSKGEKYFYFYFKHFSFKFLFVISIMTCG